MKWTKTQLFILATVAISSFMGTFVISSVNVALPAIEKEFGLNAAELSWVLTSFLLSNAMFLLPVGSWGDITGVRRLFKIGIVIFSLSTLLCGIAPSGNWLFVMRYIQGIGGAFSSTTGSAILVTAFLPKERGRILGISVSAVYLGLAFGPFLGGFLTQYLGWKSLFYISAAFGLIITIIAFIFLGKDEKTDITRKKPDLAGTLFYMAGLVGLSYGSSQIPSVTGWTMMAVGILLLVLFWVSESKSSSPAFETKLFTQNRLFAFSNLAALINYSATFAIIFLISLYLQKIKGLSPRDAGIILVAQPIVMALFSPVSGILSDKIQPRFLTTAGMAFCTTGLLAFSFLSETTPIWLVAAILMWVGIGFALFSSPNMSTIMGSVQKHQLGLASGSASTMRVVGQIISMSIATLFFVMQFGKTAVKDSPNSLFMDSLHWGFICFTILSIFGIYFSFSRGKIDRLKH